MEQTSFATNGKIYLEGFLIKRGHVRHNWKMRWFRLSESSLRYYKNKKQDVPHGRIALSNAKLDKTDALSEEERDSRENVFKVMTEDGLEYPIQASTTSEYTIWTNAIQSVIDGLNKNGISNKIQEQIDYKSLKKAKNENLKDQIGLPSDLPKGRLVKRGILFKRGHIIPSWKVRCFVLQQSPPTFSYFDPTKKVPKTLNTLSLNGATAFSLTTASAKVVLNITDPPEHLFCIKTSSGEIYLMTAASDEERDGWINMIKALCKGPIFL